MNTVERLKKMLAENKIVLDWLIQQSKTNVLSQDATDEDAIREYQETVAALTDAISRLEWVPVNKRLPTAGKYICLATNYPMILLYVNGEFIDTQCNIYTVTHWLPLPQPPAPEGE